MHYHFSYFFLCTIIVVLLKIIVYVIYAVNSNARVPIIAEGYTFFICYSFSINCHVKVSIKISAFFHSYNLNEVFYFKAVKNDLLLIKIKPCR